MDEVIDYMELAPDKHKYPNCYAAHCYAVFVLEELEVVGELVFAACERYMDDIQRDDDFELRWWTAEKFMARFQLFEHVIGEWDTVNVILEPWEKFFFLNIELFYKKSSGKRRYKTAHLEIGRGNGKSLLASGTGLLYLSAIDVVQGNKVYSCATKNEQARIVLDSAREMAKKNEDYRKNTGVKVFTHHIAVESKGCEFKALSSDSKSMDGLQPVLGIIDELHAHKTRAVYDVIDSAMSKRKDSFLLCITTAGFSLDGIGYSQSCYAKRVAMGDVDDDSFFSLVYTLDEDDDWKDPDVWIKANPNWGVSVDPENFTNKAMKAMANAADAANFQVKHLNLWQNAHSQYFSVAKWEALGNPELKLENFVGNPCFIAIDLASKVDLTSNTYVFKNLDTGKISVISRNFCPEETIANSKNNQYPEWVEAGHLIATKGAMINYPLIREDILENAKDLTVNGVPYDPWNATEFSQHLTAERLEAIEYRQNTANFSEPMKQLEALIREGNIEHDGNPLVTWCLGNVVAKADASDNVFPRKTHPDLKIDPVIAIIMGIGCWISEEEKASVYETRDIRII